MEIFLLIGLNLPAVPFLHEAEHGGRFRPTRSAWQLLRLGDARRARWFVPFCWGAAVYAAGVVLVWQALDTEVDPRIFLNLLLMQCLLWSVVLRARFTRQRRARPGPRR